MQRRFSVHQFDNGLTAVFERLPQAISTAVGFCVRTGARHEPARLDGVSHFLEHMAFKGTAQRSWQQLNREFDLLGARHNAYTDYDETCYYAWVLKEHAGRALELLTDMLQPALPPQEFDSEKKVVLEEIARSNDSPERAVFDHAMQLAFAGQRLSSTILGSVKTVGRLTREEMESYHRARYTPRNLTLFACGNVDEAALLADAERLWGGRNGDGGEAVLAPPDFQAGRRIVRKRGLVREHIVLLWPAVSLRDPRNIAAALLGAILGDDRNSRLYWALRHTGLAEDASAGYWGFQDGGLLVAQAACDPAAAGAVSAVLRKEAARLKRGIRREELQRVKNRARTGIVFGSETPFDRFRQLTQNWNVRRELLAPEELLAQVERVTLDDLADLLKEFPLEDNLALVALGPATDLRVRAPAAPRAKKKPARKKR